MRSYEALFLFAFFLIAATACNQDDGDSTGSAAIADDTADDAADDGADDTPFDPAGLVDPFVGTAGDHGQFSPSATSPFGMVKLGPDSIIRRHAGYDYYDPIITGFSHTRIEGVGCSGAGGDVRILPGAGEGTFVAAAIVKSSESASPGYYAADIIGTGGVIRTEMTATTHVGVHRYTFQSAEPAYLLITFNDTFSSPLGFEWSASDARDEISGWVKAKNVCDEGRYCLYFSMAFSRNFSAMREMPGLRGGKKLRLDFDLDNGEPLIVKVGFSSVDALSARADRDAEVPEFDFDTIHATTRERWNDALSAVTVEGGEDAALFYTMLYRTMLTPADITTQDGRYRGTDGEVHEAQDYRRYSGWSLWDTYRNKFALLEILDPERTGDIMRSLVNLYNEGKADFSTDQEPYPNVRTEHAAAILLDAQRKCVGGFDPMEAFDAIRAEADALIYDSPDQAIEASYDRWVVAQLAKDAGDETTYEDYLAQSKAYKDIWTTAFADIGSDADEVEARGLYEGTPWQYRWAVTHDIPGIIDLDGGRVSFLSHLQEFFDRDLYNHGNEPDIHAPFLFNYVGAPWRTQDLIRRLLVEVTDQWYGTHEKWETAYHGRIYRMAPAGFIPEMDDDDGTMSAWFVLAALGLYPVTIGEPTFAVTAPLFSRATLRLTGGGAFVIKAEGVSGYDRFIQSATLNGEPFNRAFLTNDEIVAGGELVFVMGPEPNTEWGTDE